jgi:hypothetical protein
LGVSPRRPPCHPLASQIRSRGRAPAHLRLAPAADGPNSLFYRSLAQAGLQTPSATFHSIHDTLTDMEGTEALVEGSVNVKDKTFYRVGAGLDVVRAHPNPTHNRQGGRRSHSPLHAMPGAHSLISLRAPLAHRT